jgi:predicted dehydrogenase
MKIAVVGFGFMGITHTLNIVNDPSLELIAIVDKYPDMIREKLTLNSGNFSTGKVSEEMLEKVQIFTTLEDCIDRAKPDACVIAVHTDLHGRLAAVALEAGIHVFLEKPFTLDPEEGSRLIELAKSRNLVLMIGHVVRFMPAYQQLRQWITDGSYGALRFLSLSRFSGIPAWGEWKEKRKSFGVSGGALFDLLIHDIDYAHWVLGIPDEVESTVLPGELSNNDYISAAWRYASGLTVRVEGGNIFHASFPFRAEFTARFDHATISFSSNRPENIIISADLDSRLVPAGDAGEGFANELTYFVHCVRAGVLPEICMPESALETIRLCYRHV